MTTSKLLFATFAFAIAAAPASAQGRSTKGTIIGAAAGVAGPGFASLAREFVFTTLSFSPTSATQNGLHRYKDPRTGRALDLDRALDDFSQASIDRQRTWYEQFRGRLRQVNRSTLGPQTRADYALLDNAVSGALFAFDEERFDQRRPQMYSENLGTALFGNISLEYADTAARAAHLTARVEQIPAFLATAAANLQASNDVYRRVAIESVEGVIDLVNGLGATFVRGTPSAARYGIARPRAVAALERYRDFIRTELPARGEFSWRMGADRFAAKWTYYLQVSMTPDEMLRGAEDSLRVTRGRMLELATPLHTQWFPEHNHVGDDVSTSVNAVVGEVLARIGAEHAPRDSLMARAAADALMLEKYVVDHRLLSLNDFSNLRVIPTPLFMRGIYGVAGAVFAPALQPELSTFYWVTPIPGEWPAERAESKLREYNRYKMLTITIHEAVPGHAVQGEYANRVTPEWRRLLRAVYGNNPYIEGWAVYAEHMMEDAGVTGGDPVKAKLTAMKGMLRIYTNAIIDIRMHTKGMTDDESVTLMMRDGFQERPEAEAKLQRAQLDYVQLNTYLAGVQEWTRLRQDAEAAEGAKFDQCRYHDTVLLYGPIPVPTVRQLYLKGVAPTAKAPVSRCLVKRD